MHRRLQCYRLTQFSAEVGSENCKYDLHCHAHRLALACCRTAAGCYTVWCTKLQKHFNAIMEVLYCFTVAIGLPGDVSDYNEDKGRQLQRAYKTRWLSSEAAVRARSEILTIWAALKQLSENKNDAMCVV